MAIILTYMSSFLLFYYIGMYIRINMVKNNYNFDNYFFFFNVLKHDLGTMFDSGILS